MIEYTRRVAETLTELGLEEFYANSEAGNNRCRIRSGCGKTVLTMPFSLNSKSKKADIDYAVDATILAVKRHAKILQEYKTFRKMQKAFLDSCVKLPNNWSLLAPGKFQYKKENVGTLVVDSTNLNKAFISHAYVDSINELLERYEEIKPIIENIIDESKKAGEYALKEKELLGKLAACNL